MDDDIKIDYQQDGGLPTIPEETTEMLHHEENESFMSGIKTFLRKHRRRLQMLLVVALIGFIVYMYFNDVKCSKKPTPPPTALPTSNLIPSLISTRTNQTSFDNNVFSSAFN